MNQNPGLSNIGALQKIIDNLPVVVFEYSIYPDGKRDFTYLSPRCEELLGLKSDVLLSGIFPMKDFIHKDDWDDLEQQVRNTVDTLEEFVWEGRLSFKGKVIWVEAKGAPVLLENKTIVTHGIITDVTLKKRAEAREQELEREFKDLLEFLPVGILIHSRGKLLYTNRYAVEMMGASKKSELVGKDIIEYIHPEFKEKAMHRIGDAATGRIVLQAEEKYFRLDGKAIDVLSSAMPVKFSGESMVLNIVIDITPQKETAIIVRRAETLFSQLFNNAPLAIVTLDVKGLVVNSNPAFEQMFGYTIDEIKGKNLEQFIVPDELTEEGIDLNKIISSYQVVRVETVRMTKDGNPLSVIIYGVPIHMEDHTIAIIGLYVDLTESKKVEEELKIRNSELDNFVYKVSHDLRAPLSSILGLVNLARLPNNTDNREEYLEIVGRKAAQLDHFIGDVLSHSKNLKLQVRIVKIELKSLIDEIFSNLTYLEGAGSVIRNVSIHGSDFHSDLWRIKEIFRNLISNAIKYRNRNLETVNIDISVDVDGNQATIVFSDNGIGIDDDKVDRIFDMFYRASEVSDGSGLGLYIVKNAVDKLRGSIEVTSKRNQGTSFKIEIPNIDIGHHGN